jgi:predicted acetyltransferase
MVKAAKDDDCKSIISLWKSCFKDKDEYLDFYFTTRYKKEYTLVYTEGESVVSSLQAYPFDMTYLKDIIKTQYILGVCTQEEYRKKGYSKQLLLESINKAIESGVTIQTLIPQEVYLFNIYAKYGFVNMFNVSNISVSKNDYTKETNAIIYNKSDFNNLFKFYDKWYRSDSCRVLKNLEDFNFTIEDALINDAKIFINKTNGIIDGFALLANYDGEYVVKEILFFDKEVCDSLIVKMFDTIPIDKMTVVFPRGFYESYNYNTLGMARVINPKKLLEIYAKNNPSANFTIKLEDDIIVSNNCIFSVGNSKITVDSVDNYDFCMNIGEFTQFILGYEFVDNNKNMLITSNPYLNLMLN